MKTINAGFGGRLSHVLESIEDSMWEYEAHVGLSPNYTDGGFRAGIKIFMSVIMDKMWKLQESEVMSMEDRGKMADKAGQDIRNLIKTYTGIDAHKLYE